MKNIIVALAIAMLMPFVALAHGHHGHGHHNHHGHRYSHNCHNGCHHNHNLCVHKRYYKSCSICNDPKKHPDYDAMADHKRKFYLRHNLFKEREPYKTEHQTVEEKMWIPKPVKVRKYRMVEKDGKKVRQYYWVMEDRGYWKSTTTKTYQQKLKD